MITFLRDIAKAMVLCIIDVHAHHLARKVRKLVKREDIEVWILRTNLIGHLLLNSRISVGLATERTDSIKNRRVILLSVDDLCNFEVWNLIKSWSNDKVEFSRLESFFWKIIHLLPWDYRRAISQLASTAVRDAANQVEGVADAESMALETAPSFRPAYSVPELAVSQSLLSSGFETFGEIGITPQVSIALVIDRDLAFYGSERSLRDTSIEDLTTIIEVLISRGFFVVRLGNRRLDRVPITSARFLDYPFQKMQSERNEVFLSAISSFSVTWNTGLAMLPASFGVPTTLLTPGLPSIAPDTLGISMPLTNIQTKQSWSGLEVVKQQQEIDCDSWHLDVAWQVSSIDKCLAEKIVEVALAFCDKSREISQAPRIREDSDAVHKLSKEIRLNKQSVKPHPRKHNHEEITLPYMVLLPSETSKPR